MTSALMIAPDIHIRQIRHKRLYRVDCMTGSLVYVIDIRDKVAVHHEEIQTVRCQSCYQ